MEPFREHTGKIAVLDQDNVDTDRIIPARFLSRVSRAGYGELLFADVRGPEFPLDAPDARGASILVAGANFGCGSSREHAAWAIQQAGFKVVVARKTSGSPGFSDIFRQNSANNGMLLVELAEAAHAKLVAAGSGAEVTVDLANQKVVVGGEELPFEISPMTKQALIEGLDLIGTTLIYDAQVAEYERRDERFVPPRAEAGS